MRFAKFLLPCLLLLGGSSIAKADYGALGLAYLFGYQNPYGGFRSFGPSPPYFALHPPVYYGQRYTRPYGVSPFATWPQLNTTPAYAPRPHVQRAAVTICNPYSGCSTGAISDALIVAKPTQPLVIENPFYPGDDDNGDDKVQYTANH